MPITIRSAARCTLWVPFVLAGMGGGTLHAHEGPPYPLFMDEPLGEHRVSLWADPDIGEARFFVILESLDGADAQPPEQVVVWAEPTSGRLQRADYKASRQPLRNHVQFAAAPYFDRRDMWRIGVAVTSADGLEREVVTEVESTPPGFGMWDLVIYLFPFLMIGFLWVAAVVRRRTEGADALSGVMDVSGRVASSKERIRVGSKQ